MIEQGDLHAGKGGARAKRGTKQREPTSPPPPSRSPPAPPEINHWGLLHRPAQKIWQGGIPPFLCPSIVGERTGANSGPETEGNVAGLPPLSEPKNRVFVTFPF